MAEKDNEFEPNELAEMIKKINESTKYKIVSADDYQFIEQRRRSRLGFGSPSDRKSGSFLGERRFSSDRSDNSHYIEIPKLPIFSGSDEVPKGEVNYEVWSFEVKCLQSAETPEDVLSQAIRRSLRGLARGMLVHIGTSASSEEILNKLDGFYGNVSTAEELMQQFYGDSQKEGESIVSYASRLESTIMKAIKLGHIDTYAKDSMLRSKFWTGLKNTQLRNATRHKYDSLSDFQTLLKEIRQVEVEEQNLVKSKDPKPKTAQQHQASASASSEKFSNEEIYKQLCQLKSQLDKLEHKMSSEKRVHQEKPSESYHDYSQGGYDNFRGRGRGFRPFGRRNRGRGPRQSFRGRGGNYDQGASYSEDTENTQPKG